MNTPEFDTDTQVKFVLLKEAEYRGLQNEKQHMQKQIAALSEENRNLKQQVRRFIIELSKFLIHRIQDVKIRNIDLINKNVILLNTPQLSHS